MKLDLKRIWEVMNKLSYEETKLSEEKDKYVQLLGHSSNYCNYSFEGFLNYYSFRIEDNVIVVYNNDGIPYENFTNNDFSYVPTELIDMSEEDLDVWIEVEVERQLEAQRVNKLAEKENIKEQIKRLEKQLEQ